MGEPAYMAGKPDAEAALMRWQNADGAGTGVSVNYRMPIAKLRALARQSPPPAQAPGDMVPG